MERSVPLYVSDASPGPKTSDFCVFFHIAWQSNTCQNLHRAFSNLAVCEHRFQDRSPMSSQRSQSITCRSVWTVYPSSVFFFSSFLFFLLLIVYMLSEADLSFSAQHPPPLLTSFYVVCCFRDALQQALYAVPETASFFTAFSRIKRSCPMQKSAAQRLDAAALT